MIGSMKISAWLIAVVLLVAGLASCRRTPDEQQVREAIVAMQQAAQAGNARQLAASLSDDFEGNAGQLEASAVGCFLPLQRPGSTSGTGRRGWHGFRSVR